MADFSCYTIYVVKIENKKQKRMIVMSLVNVEWYGDNVFIKKEDSWLWDYIMKTSDSSEVRESVDSYWVEFEEGKYEIKIEEAIEDYFVEKLFNAFLEAPYKELKILLYSIIFNSIVPGPLINVESIVEATEELIEETNLNDEFQYIIRRLISSMPNNYDQLSNVILCLVDKIDETTQLNAEEFDMLFNIDLNDLEISLERIKND